MKWKSKNDAESKKKEKNKKKQFQNIEGLSNNNICRKQSSQLSIIFY